MRTVTYTDVRDRVLAGMGLAVADASALNLTNVAMAITQAMDYAWYWASEGWPELRKAASRTASSSVISLDRDTGIDPIGKVLGVTQRNPWTSVNPNRLPFNINSGGIILSDDIGASAAVFVTYLKPAPRFTSTAWVTATAYTAGALRAQGDECYECLTAHTSGTFATDLAAAKWEKQDVPTFLAEPVRAGAVALLNGNEGESGRMRFMQDVMDDLLGEVSARYDYGRWAGNQTQRYPQS